MDIFSKHKLLSRSVLFLVVLNLVTLGFFVWKEFKPHKEPLLFPINESYKDVSNILKKELHLSNKQVIQFDKIRSQNFIKQAYLKRIIRNQKDAMNLEMFNKNSDEQKIMQLARQIANNEYAMEMLRYNQAKELKAVCTPEQLEKFEKLVLEIRDYFRPDNQPLKK